MATATTTTRLRPRVELAELLGGPGARRLGLGAAVLGAELLLAGALATGRLTFLLIGLLAVAVLGLCFTYPMGMSVAMLALGVSVFHAEWFDFAVGPLNANVPEVILLCLLVVAITRPVRRTWGGFAGVALAAFFGLLAVSTIVAVEAEKVDLLGSFAWSRNFLFFLFFYVVVRLFPERESLTRLLTWGIGIAAATGFLAVYLSVFSGPGSIFQDSSQQFIRSEEGMGIIERVRLPGLALAYGLFWWAVVKAVRPDGGRRGLWGIALLGMFLNIMVSFNRNMWVGLSLGLLAMLLLSGPLVRRRLVGAVAVVVLVVTVLASQAGSDSRITPLVERGASLTDSESLQAESSLQSREIETDVALRVAGENPLIGIGAGVDFGVSFYEATPGGVWVRVSQYFLHNQYLYLWLIAGIPALIAFLGFLLNSLRSAWRWRSRTPESAAWGVGLASIMLSAYVAIYFSAPEMVVAICLLAAAAFSARDWSGTDPPAAAPVGR